MSRLKEHRVVARAVGDQVNCPDCGAGASLALHCGVLVLMCGCPITFRSPEECRFWEEVMVAALGDGTEDFGKKLELALARADAVVAERRIRIGQCR